MDFFESQARARRNTAILAALFAVAVGAIGAGIYTVVRLVVHYGLTPVQPAGAPPGTPVRLPPFTWFEPELFLWVMGGTVAFIGLISLYRIVSLREGGASVAAMMGGREVSPDTGNLEERRLRNVVAEMALASGTPVPRVFVLDAESAINAFAAGLTPGDAVIAVTRGALEQLSRDRLQAVIAHEFSHILNGDMRLNLRLMGFLYGILSIAVVGRWILYVSRGGKGRANLPLGAAGLVLFVLGYGGVLVGRVIQSAVSRQREFLADASAVQFTRNPEAVAGALKQIAGFTHHSYLVSPRTQEVSHLLFGEGEETGFFGRLWATHPPIVERIRRIEAGFVAPAAVASDFATVPVTAAGFVGGTVSLGRVGRPDPESLDGAGRVLSGLSDAVHEAVRTPSGAESVVYALLLDPDPRVAEVQVRGLRDAGKTAEALTALMLREGLGGQEGSAALAIVDLAVPALRSLSDVEKVAVLKRVYGLVMADRRRTLAEFAIERLLRHRLMLPKTDSRAGTPGKLAVHLVAGIARAGSKDASGGRIAFLAGLKRLGLSGEALTAAFDAGEIGSLDQAAASLDGLAEAPFAVRRRVLDAAIACVQADGTETPEEAELLRLTAAILGCPLPRG